MTESEFLEPDVVLFLHDQALREYGGIQGVKNEDLLHSALWPAGQQARLRRSRRSKPVRSCRCLCLRARQQPPFNDDNKRTAWSSCVLFLKVNGADINVMARDAVEQMVRLATKSVDKSGFAAWQRQS